MTTQTPQDFLVQGLDAIEPAYGLFPGKMYAGLLPSDNGDRRGMTQFWMFQPDVQKVPETIVLWLNGGPGCSSFNCGVMMEHSPVTQPLHEAGYCCIKTSTPKLGYNEHTWTKVTTMLYVEHPIGTGFSYGQPLPETEAEASADLDAFLQNFFNVFTELKSYKFYVFGESYAGMFVPSVTHYLHFTNKENLPGRFNIPIAGAAIGNGWMNGKVQGPATIDYSWWHGLIDKPTRDALHTEWNNCMLERGKSYEKEPPPFHPFNVQDDCGTMWGILQAAGNPNAYDITTWDPNVDQITFTSEAFYNREDVRMALHAPMNITWHGCRWGEGRRRLASRQLHLYMEFDQPMSVVPYVGQLVDDGVPILVYNGDRDMTTNMVGSELILNEMDWSGKDEWLNATRGLWRVNDANAGWAKQHKALTFLVVYNSGHMVPYNVPVPALDLVERMLTGASFLDVELPTIRIAPVSLESLATEASQAGVNTAAILPANFKLGFSQGETFLIALVSMLLGVVLTLGLVRRSSSRGNYHRVPDAAVQITC